MALLISPYPRSYLQLGDTRIPVYNSIPIQNPNNVHPNSITQLLCDSRPVPYPYTWYVHGDQAAVINANDLDDQLPSLPLITTNQQHQLSYDIIDDAYVMVAQVANESFFDEAYVMVDQVANESFEEPATHVPCSGLTKKIISEKLQVTKYCEKQEEEKDEICVVCQVEFGRNQRLAVLQCKHRYHPRCITPWLLRQNACPICKAHGLSVYIASQSSLL